MTQICSQFLSQLLNWDLEILLYFILFYFILVFLHPLPVQHVTDLRVLTFFLHLMCVTPLIFFHTSCFIVQFSYITYELLVQAPSFILLYNFKTDIKHLFS